MRVKNQSRSASMRVSSYAVIASVGAAVATNTTGTPCASGFLEFNATNVAYLTSTCAGFNYICTVGDHQEFENITQVTDYVTSNCTEFAYNIGVDRDVNGSLTIPGISTAAQVVVQGQWPTHGQPEEPLNLTGLDLPDLVSVTSSPFLIEYADKLQSLSVPKLTNVSTTISINLTGEAPPPINLSFPSLYEATWGIYLYGNIDVVELPVLNNTGQVNITSTGNLDCEALAKSVVNATTGTWMALNPPGNNSVICNSKKASVTTFRMPKSTKASGANSCFGKAGGKSLAIFSGVLTAMLILAA